MNEGVGPHEYIFGMPLPACLIESIKDRRWVGLADSPELGRVFGETSVRPAFHSIPGMMGMTKWWREELDEETLRCYFGTSDEYVEPGYMSRLKTVFIGNLGPDLPFVLDYRTSPVAPNVAFLGEEGSWRKISESVCDLLLALRPVNP
ncbi:SMI1/KNR4 family protein [Streptomyces alkaliphilus]|uniref:SMI1/KNR4 family protein n=1 Tax=Streptomyces alkaliphilus TaxID=1472722 RepID=UPI0015FC5DAD|nr:SMI1/KNR4 family protein [Streptomyces alkaliphilus]